MFNISLLIWNCIIRQFDHHLFTLCWLYLLQIDIGIILILNFGAYLFVISHTWIYILFLRMSMGGSGFWSPHYCCHQISSILLNLELSHTIMMQIIRSFGSIRMSYGCRIGASHFCFWILEEKLSHYCIYWFIVLKI